MAETRRDIDFWKILSKKNNLFMFTVLHEISNFRTLPVLLFYDFIFIFVISADLSRIFRAFHNSTIRKT